MQLQITKAAPAARLAAVLALLSCPFSGSAQPSGQTAGSAPMESMPGMAMHSADTATRPADPASAGAFLMRMASGTSINPAAAVFPMRMQRTGEWSLMFMGQAFAVEAQQTGPRGHDKLYSVNWAMFSATHPLGRGAVMLQTMLSLEPLTITDRSYPELFQTGETAYGVPLVDAQHPHNFVMALGAQYARPVGEHSMLQLYYAPVGDPALGPVAFPHRASAEDLPQAPLGHHWEDSTHIAGNVATAAWQQGWLRAEASGFYGTEPGENRWQLPLGPMNSWAGRVWLTPTRDWALQASAGRLAHPERQEPGDVVRVTASAAYSRRLATGRSWSSSLIWGRNHYTQNRRNLDAFLLESVLPLERNNALTGRVECVTKDDLFANEPALQTQLAAAGLNTFPVHAYTGGYTRTLRTVFGVEMALGANFTGYQIPASLDPYYGAHPVAASVYLRLRLADR